MKEKTWTVRSPHGIVWRPRFSSEDAAWRRIENYDRMSGESDKACRRRLTALGWRVADEAPEPVL